MLADQFPMWKNDGPVCGEFAEQFQNILRAAFAFVIGDVIVEGSPEKHLPNAPQIGSRCPGNFVVSPADTAVAVNVREGCSKYGQIGIEPLIGQRPQVVP